MGEEAAVRERVVVYLAGYPHTILAKPEGVVRLVRHVHDDDAHWFRAHADAPARLRPYIEAEFWPSHDARWTSVLVRRLSPGVRLREPAAPHPLAEGQAGVTLTLDADGRVWRQEGAMSHGERSEAVDTALADLWGILAPPLDDGLGDTSTTSDTPGGDTSKAKKAKKAKGNPMLARYGVGPSGVACATCVHLRRDVVHDYAYYKCRLRGVSGGSGTDHRRKWPACARHAVAPTAAPETEAGAGHTMPAYWWHRLPVPARQTEANTLTCPHCGLLLGFHAWEHGHTVTYGVKGEAEYTAECARCLLVAHTTSDSSSDTQRDDDSDDDDDM